MARYNVDVKSRDSKGRQECWRVTAPAGIGTVPGTEIGEIDTSDHGYQAWSPEGDPVGLPVMRRELAAEALWRRDVRQQMLLAMTRLAQRGDDEFAVGMVAGLKQALDIFEGKEQVR